MRNKTDKRVIEMKKINYEKSVLRLEEIVDKLENGNLPLEDMMKLYEEGTQLAAVCAKSLEEAQLKITELSSGKVKNDD